VRAFTTAISFADIHVSVPRVPDRTITEPPEELSHETID